MASKNRNRLTNWLRNQKLVFNPKISQNGVMHFQPALSFDEKHQSLKHLETTARCSIAFHKRHVSPSTFSSSPWMTSVTSVKNSPQSLSEGGHLDLGHLIKLNHPSSSKASTISCAAVTSPPRLNLQEGKSFVTTQLVRVFGRSTVPNPPCQRRWSETKTTFSYQFVRFICRELLESL